MHTYTKGILSGMWSGKWFITVGFALFLLPSSASAAAYYWVGPDGGSVADAGNWKLSNPTGCGGGDAERAPGPPDDVFFVSDCPHGALIDEAFSVYSITMEEGYGTLQQGENAPLTVGEFGFYMAGGKFRGSDTPDSPITIHHDFSIVGDSASFVSTKGVLKLSGYWQKTGLGKFDPNGGTVELAPTADARILGSTTFSNLRVAVTTARTLTFEAGTTQTITKDLVLQGASAEAQLSLRSSIEGAPWKINPQGTRTMRYLDVQDSTNTSFFAISCVTVCTDARGNTRWRFSSSPYRLLLDANSIDGTPNSGDISLETRAEWIDPLSPARKAILKNFSLPSTPKSGWHGDGTVQNPYRLAFDGSNDVVSMGVLDDPYSLSLWLRADVSDARQCIICNSWEFNAVTLERGVVTIRTRGGHYHSSALDPKQWNHLVVMNDGKSSVFYLNGARVIAVDGGGTRLITEYLLGARPFGSSFIEHFTGEISSVALYSGGLGDDEVLELYEKGLARYRTDATSALHIARMIPSVVDRAGGTTVVVRGDVADIGGLTINGIAVPYSADSTTQISFTAPSADAVSGKAGAVAQLEIVSRDGLQRAAAGLLYTAIPTDSLLAWFDPSDIDGAGTRGSAVPNILWASRMSGRHAILHKVALPSTVTSGWQGRGTPSDPDRLQLNGIDTYVAAGNLGNEVNTVSVWFKADVADGVDRMIIGNAWDQTVASVRNNLLTVTAGSPRSTAIDLRVWNHFVIARDSTQANYYLNGRLFGTEKVSAIALNPSFLFGARQFGASIVGHFGGSLGPVRFYKSTLNAGEIAQTFHEEAERFNVQAAVARPPSPTWLPTDGLLLRLDARNVDARGAKGPSVASPTWSSLSSAQEIALKEFARPGTAQSGWQGDGTVQRPYSLRFDGVDDHARIGYSGNAKTVVLWVKAPTDDREQYILSDPAGFYAMRLQNGVVTIRNSRSTATALLSDEEWHQLAFTDNGTEVQYFFDGTPFAKGPHWRFGTNSDMLLGAQQFGGTTTGHFRGSIADLLLYNRSLSQKELLGIYEAGRLLFKELPSQTEITGLAPAVSKVSGGDTVVIRGEHFTDATSVTVNGASAAFTVDGPTQITITTPPADANPAKEIPAGSFATVEVTTSLGTAIAANALLYTKTPLRGLAAFYHAGNINTIGAHGPNSPGTTWRSLATSRTAKLRYFVQNTDSGWEGDGSISKPYALHFNGESTFVDLGRIGDENGDVFSYSLWVKPDRIDSTIRYPLGNSANAWNIVGYQYGLVTASSQVGGGRSTAMQLGTWNLVTVTKEGPVARLYINGKLYDTDTDRTGSINFDYMLGATGSNGTPIPGTYFDGSIAEFRMYTRALSEDEIRSINDEGRLRFVADPAGPTIARMSPSADTTDGGSSVIIHGTNLYAATNVMIGAAAAPFTILSPTQLRVTTPSAAAAGATAGAFVTVTVQTPAGTTAATEIFKYSRTARADHHALWLDAAMVSGGPDRTLDAQSPVWASLANGRDASFAVVAPGGLQGTGTPCDPRRIVFSGDDAVDVMHVGAVNGFSLMFNAAVSDSTRRSILGNSINVNSYAYVQDGKLVVNGRLTSPEQVFDIETNRWYQLTVTNNGSSTRYFLNGKYGGESPGSNYDINHGRILGAQYNGNEGRGNYFKGSLAIARLFASSLTDADALDMYNEEKGRFGMPFINASGVTEYGSMKPCQGVGSSGSSSSSSSAVASISSVPSSTATSASAASALSSMSAASSDASVRSGTSSSTSLSSASQAPVPTVSSSSSRSATSSSVASATAPLSSSLSSVISSLVPSSKSSSTSPAAVAPASSISSLPASSATSALVSISVASSSKSSAPASSAISRAAVSSSMSSSVSAPTSSSVSSSVVSSTLSSSLSLSKSSSSTSSLSKSSVTSSALSSGKSSSSSSSALSSASSAKSSSASIASSLSSAASAISSTVATSSVSTSATTSSAVGLSSAPATSSTAGLSSAPASAQAQSSSQSAGAAQSASAVPPFETLPPTTISLDSSLNPSIIGENVTIVATVVPPQATGTVTFKDDGTVIGTAPVSEGKATIETSLLPIGIHPLTAVYGGDLHYADSTSPRHMHTVLRDIPLTPIPFCSLTPPSKLPGVNGFLAPTAGGDLLERGKQLVFQDVALDAQYALGVYCDVSAGVSAGTAKVNGEPTGLYEPGRPINYAEALRKVLEVAGEAVERTYGHEWYIPYYKVAKELQLPLFATRFPRPHAYIPRGDFISLLLAALKVEITPATVAPFKDVPLSDRNADAIAMAKAMGLVYGDRDEHGNLTGFFRPNHDLIRAESAQLMMRTMELPGFREYNPRTAPVPNLSEPKSSFLEWLSGAWSWIF